MRVSYRPTDADGSRAVELLGDVDAVITSLAAGPVHVTLEPASGDRAHDATIHSVLTDERGNAFASLAPSPATPADHAAATNVARVPWGRLTVLLVAVWSTVAVLSGGLRPLWYDESWSVAFAHRPFSAWWPMIEFGEMNMVGYHLLLKAWTVIVGSAPIIVRLPSTVAMALCAWVMFRIARRIWSPRVGFGAVAVFLTSAAVLEYAQQARSYAFATLLASVSAYVLLRWHADRRRALLVLWVAVAGITATTHVFGAFAVAGQLLGALAVVGRRERRALLAAGAAAAAVTAPVGFLLVTASGGGSQVAWIERPSWHTIFDVATLVAGGRGVLGAALVALLVWAALRKGGEPRDATRGFAHALLVGWIAFPVIASLVATFVDQSLVVPRYYLVSLPAVLLLAAAGARRSLGDLWTAAVVVLALVGVLYQAQFLAARPSWDGAAAAAVIAREVRPGDGLVLVPAWARIDLEWHLADVDPRALDALVPVYPSKPLGGLEPITELTAADGDDPVRDRFDETERVWVVQAQGASLPESLQRDLAAFPVRDTPHDVAAYSVRLYERSR
jgi:mannosyltransferase